MKTALQQMDWLRPWILVAILAGIGTAGFASSIGGWALGWAVFAGAALALSIAGYLKSRSFHSTERILISMLAMLLLGPLLALSSPTPSGFATFFQGVSRGWADVLTSTPRVPASDAILVPPYVLSWAATTLGLVIISRVRLPGLAALPAFIAFGITMLFGGDFGLRSILLAAALSVGALLLGWMQQRSQFSGEDHRIGNTTALVRRGRALHATALLLGIAVVAPLLGSLLPGFDDDRYDIRHWLEPPWQPLDEPSPLAEVKQNLLPDNREVVVFSASGSDLPSRWALATLAHYDDGFVWTVGDTAAGGQAEFIPVDRTVPADPVLGTDFDPNDLVEVSVEIPGDQATQADQSTSDQGNVDLGVWVPLPGRAVEVQAVNSNGETVEVRVNERTGTVAIPAGSAGHTVTALVAPFAEAGTDTFEVVGWNPEADSGTEASAFRSILGRLSQRSSCAEGQQACVPEPCAASSWDAVVCVQENLQDGGYLIEVGAREAAPGHSIPRLIELAADREPELYTGFEEQYGALAGLAARRAGVTARVVVGYIADEDQPPSSIEMTAESIDVWLEVLTDQGWVSVDVTPDRENEPQLNNPGRSTQPITDQIPPVPPPPPALVDNQNVDEQEELEEEEEEEEEDGPRSLVARAGIAAMTSLAVPTAIGLVWLGAMGLLKARRSNRRRNSANPGHRVAGAWYDSLDRLAESGHAPEDGLSTSEFAEIIDLRFEGATQMRELAVLVDAAAFGPNEVDSEISERAWERHDQTRVVLNRHDSRMDTLRRLANPAPLFRSDPVPHDTSSANNEPSRSRVGDMS